MTRMTRTIAILLALLTTASLSPATWAQNNKKGGGGGSGGGGDGGGSTTLSYRTIALSQQYGYVSSINSQGQMVGMIQDDDGTYLPYRWEVNTADNVTATQLDLTFSGGLGLGVDGVANHINDQGIMAGVVVFAAEEDWTAVIWLDENSAATMLPLTAPPEGTRYDSGEAFAISHQPDVERFPGLRAVVVGRFMWRFLEEPPRTPSPSSLPGPFARTIRSRSRSFSIWAIRVNTSPPP
jgi:hypothetical protein